MPHAVAPSPVRVLLPLLVAAVAVVDAFLPFGYAGWALYLAALVLTVSTRSTAAPVQVAAVATAAILLVPLVKPEGGDPLQVVVNRGLTIGCLWLMAAVLRRSIAARLAVQREEHLRAGKAQVLAALQGDFPLQEHGRRLLDALTRALGAHAGALYVADGRGELRRVAAVGLADVDALPEGLGVGPDSPGSRLARGGARVLTELPPGFLRVRTALGEADAGSALLAPLQLAGATVGLVELARVDHAPLDIELVERIGELLARGLRAAQDQERRDELLEETQRQSEELLQQQEELRVANEELEAQTQELETSQARLEEQASELEAVNARMHEHVEALREAKLQAEQASRQKSAFLSNVSHELRTPLNSVLLLASLLDEDGLTPTQHGHVQAIRSAGRDLLALIDDLLDLSRVEAGRLEVTLCPEPVAALVESTRAGFEAVAAERGLGFQVLVAPGTPTEVHTDAARVRQVLRNLLANAFKFTTAGEVRLEVRPAGDGVAFAVHDTGPGVAPEDRERVFEPFLQLDDSARRQHGGAGLGLAISRDLARRLGGTLTLESAPGEGATLTLTLPAAPATAPEVAVPSATSAASAIPATSAPAAAPAPAAGRSRRLLLLDAGPAVAQRVTERFGARDVEVTALRDVDAALERLDGGSWDALVVGADEGEAVEHLVRTLAADERFAFPPVIVHARRPLGRGPGARLAPYVRSIVASDGESEDRLLDEIMLAISAPAGRAPAPPSTGERDRDREAAFRDRVILVAEDDARNVHALRQVFEPRGARLLVAGNGREALEILASGAPVDLVLMDIMMPEMDGYTAIREIRRRPDLAGIPIVALTAKAMVDDRNRCLAAGANDYISKPVDLDKLLALARIWMPT